ncbi:MAG: citrate lyase acyl carrier protein [Oscillospiraceae bacterium]|nr:citrate lyase acyl carrier protein [Oscillospiraceae bacterium]
MRLTKAGIAGTMESSDVMVTVRPAEEAGIRIAIESKVEAQYGDEMRQTVLDVMNDFGIEAAEVELRDRGALDCVIRARTQTAVCRALGTGFDWKGEDR